MLSILRTKGNCLDIPQLLLLQILKQLKFCSSRKKAEEFYLQGLPENIYLNIVKFYEKKNAEIYVVLIIFTYLYLFK